MTFEEIYRDVRAVSMNRVITRLIDTAGNKLIIIPDSGPKEIEEKMIDQLKLNGYILTKVYGDKRQLWEIK